MKLKLTEKYYEHTKGIFARWESDKWDDELREVYSKFNTDDSYVDYDVICESGEKYILSIVAYLFYYAKDGDMLRSYANLEIETDGHACISRWRPKANAELLSKTILRIFEFLLEMIKHGYIEVV